MIIQHNISAINSNRQLGIVTDNLADSTEKLSSGYSINRSADDAAGLSISEKMRKQIRGLNRAAENIEDGISYAQVADGALNEVHDILQRINELSVQAANGTNSASDREHINDEVQQLKSEMERIFETTSFNNKQIWKEDITVYKNVVGQVQVQSTEIATPSRQNIVVNNETFGLLPSNEPNRSGGNLTHSFYNSSSDYTIHADKDTGVWLTWNAYNGTSYKTKTIDWDTLRANNFSFNVGDYFQNKDSDGNAITDASKQLLDANGNAKFDFEISLGVVTGASNEEVAKAINNTTMSQSVTSSATFEDENKSLTNAGMSSAGCSFVYSAAYADSVLATNSGKSGYDFETPSDSFIEPKTDKSGGTGNIVNAPNIGKDLAGARASNEAWTFAFTSKGLGNLTATSSQISYYSNDTSVTPDPATTPYSSTSTNWTGRDVDDKGIFWEPTYTYNYPYRTEKHWYSSTKYYSVPGTLGGLMSTLTGTKGLLSKTIKDGSATGNKGATDSGGRIYITFDITSDNEYVYGKDSNGNDLKSNIVGSFSVYLDVSSSDTEQSILDKINKAFNKDTLFDLNFKTSNDNTATVYKSSRKTSAMMKNDYVPADMVDDINLNIHSGAETTDKIGFDYECLRLRTIGMTDTNVLTEADALAAIDEVADALNIVSAQRSLFGAYQNRMEHAYNIDKNSSENTQSAESQIRDTDMAKEMIKYSNLNILGQAGQAMLAQSNQKNQGILSLLN